MNTAVEILHEPCEFWMVWTKTGRNPSRTHWTEAAAMAEAQRLAASVPGKKFIVLRGYAKFLAAPAPEDIEAALAARTLESQA